MEAALLPAPEAGFAIQDAQLKLVDDPLDDAMSPWAFKQYLDKYSWKDEFGEPTEVWPDTAYRVVRNELGALGYTDHDWEFRRLVQLITERKLIPGGRKLAQAGRQYHQTNNCFSGITRFLTDEGVVSLAQAYAEGGQVRVRNRFGKWEDAAVERFGMQSLKRITFANGDQIDVTADHLWWQEDMRTDHATRVPTTEVERVPFSVAAEAPALAPEGVRHGIVYGDGTLCNEGRYSRWDVVNGKKDAALIDWFENEDRCVTVGGGATRTYGTVRLDGQHPVVALQPAHYKQLPTTYTPEYARGFIAGLIATDGHVSRSGSIVIHQEGMDVCRQIAEIAVAGGYVVTSVRVASRTNPYSGEERELGVVRIKPFSAENAILLSSHQANININQRRRMMRLDVESVDDLPGEEPVYCIVAPETESFTLANGLITSNCFLYRCRDSREGWFQELLPKCGMALSSGGGIGVVYSDVRASGSRIHKTGGVATGPLTPANMVNDAARRIISGGNRRAAIWAGLHWSHPDIFDWIVEKDWPDYIKDMKRQAVEEGKDQDVMAPLDMTNISVILDTEFFEAYNAPEHPRHELAQEVYWKATEHMVKHGEPGFSIDTGENEGENNRNACTEITSADDSDVCNLGSINLARVESIEEFKEIVDISTLFLLAGTVYSDIPHEEVKATREKNRRLGLGVMGLHEWMLARGYRYEMVPELRNWLEVYAQSTEFACEWADKHELSHPVKTRAIAPTGTIGILAETTTGIEPLFCVAYKRRFLDTDGVWKYQYVIDPIAQRLIDQGIKPDDIETAYDLSYNVERRIRFQAELQEYVDHSMASTINLPYAMTDKQEVRGFGETLMEYLPRLRGVTCYPDGTRAGQPLEAVPYEVALGKTGVTFDDNRDNACAGGSCGV